MLAYCPTTQQHYEPWLLGDARLLAPLEEERVVTVFKRIAAAAALSGLAIADSVPPSQTIATYVVTDVLLGG